VARALIAAALLAAVLAVGGADAATPRSGGTVVVAWPGAGPEPGCVAGCQPASLIGSDVIELVLRKALVSAPGGWNRGVVSRTSMTRTPPVVTLEINPRARWSDGRPITAADFVLGFETAVRDLPPFVREDLESKVARVAAAGPRAVRMELKRPTADWRDLSGRMLPLPNHALSLDHRPVHAWRSAVVDPRSGRRIGSGPFLLEQFQPGRQLVLARNPRYWGPRPARLERLVFRFGVGDPVGALRRGEVDVVGGLPLATQTALAELQRELRRNPARSVGVLRGPGLLREHLEFRLGPGGHPALQNRLVRQAVAYGIDRQAIVRDLAGRGTALRLTDSTAFLPTARGYEANWRAYRHRPAVARRLLEQAGCRRGADGVYVCGGQRLSIELAAAAGQAHRQRTLELMRTQLQRVGIEVVPRYVPAIGAYMERGSFDAALVARGELPPVAVNVVYRCGQPNNLIGYCNRLVQRDLQQLPHILRPGRYIAVANQADRKLARDVPVIPLYQYAHYVGYRTSVRGIRPHPFGAVAWNAEDWWLAR
jgi:peptide/nickel transport system substrate-binding protein